jgi:hypothetical protein
MGTTSNANSLYDDFQTTFFLSLLSNAAGVNIYTADSLNAAVTQMLNILTAACQQAIINTPQIGTGWTVAWGPAVYCAGPMVGTTDQYTPTNAAVVFYKPAGTNDKGETNGRYVVAIAATNLDSVYDWIIEDFDIFSQVNWAAAMQKWSGQTIDWTSSSFISSGTYNGMCSILTNLNGTNYINSQNPTQNLITFLNSLSPQATDTLTFTGHSLAGALSPALAAACFDANNPLLQPTIWKASNAMVYPTAGATPGNGDFANQFNGIVFSKGTNSNYNNNGIVDQEVYSAPAACQVWNTDIWNTLDVVPHAWQTTIPFLNPYPQPPYLGQIPPLYDAYYIDALDQDAINVAITTAKTASMVGSYHGCYKPIQNSSLQGAFYYSYDIAGFSTQIMTQEQAATLSTIVEPQTAYEKALQDTTPQTIPWQQQLVYQHTKAYSQLILGINIPFEASASSYVKRSVSAKAA